MLRGRSTKGRWLGTVIDAPDPQVYAELRGRERAARPVWPAAEPSVATPHAGPFEGSTPELDGCAPGMQEANRPG